MGESPIGRTKYSAAQREEAISYALQHGNSEASRKLGIPRGNIQRWLQEAGLNPGVVGSRMEAATNAATLKRNTLREKVRIRLLERAMYALDRMDKPHVEVRGTSTPVKVTLPTATDAGVQSLALAAAVLIDKFRLEMGEATTRGESRDLTRDDHEAELLRDAIRGELARRHSLSDVTANRPDDRAASAGVDEVALAGDAAAGTGAPE